MIARSAGPARPIILSSGFQSRDSSAMNTPISQSGGKISTLRISHTTATASSGWWRTWPHTRQAIADTLTGADAPGGRALAVRRRPYSSYSLLLDIPGTMPGSERRPGSVRRPGSGR